MTLTTREEEAIILQYTETIWNIVHKFMRKCRVRREHADDLFQESVLVLLGHIRLSKTEAAMKVIPVLDMTNAMCRYVLGEQALSAPRRTSSFKKIILSMPPTVSLNNDNFDVALRGDFTEDLVGHMSIRQFAESLDGADGNIVRLKERGASNNDVARTLGMTPCGVSRALKRIRGDYLTQIAV